MDQELLKKSKLLLHNKYGSALAGKATDAFLLSALALIAPESGNRLTPERMANSVTLPNAILELKDLRKPSLGGRVTGMARLRQVLKGIHAGASTSAGTLSLPEIADHRQNRIQAYRERFLSDSRAIYDYLVRSTASVRPGSHLPLPGRQNQLCWLNQTIRAVIDLQALAEVAADSSISRLDVPRKVFPEIHHTGSTVWASQYRHKTLRTGKGVIVAVIDSEIQKDHSAFGGRVQHRANFTNEPWGHPDSHGTGVAGIIGSEDDDYMGMAPEVEIYNYKVLATDPTAHADDFEAALAIEKALEDGAQIANCSWGTGPATDGSSREAKACDQAWELGLSLVKSAGNVGPDMRTLTSPADAAGIIVVGATDKEGSGVEAYSSRGPLPSGELRPHLLAPGGGMVDGICSCLTGGGFGNIKCGTSFAAAHVTGLLALILEDNDSLSPDDQWTLLQRLCRRLDGFAEMEQGAGLISLAQYVS